MSYDVIIIGGGPGGTRAAALLAAAGKRVALIEDRHWGGTCLNCGCIPTKMLLGAAAPSELIQAQQRLRVLKGESSVDFAALQNRIRRFLKGSSQTLARNLTAQGVTLLEGRGTCLGEGRVQVKTADGEHEIQGTDIILSCGSRNAVFPGLAPDGDCVLDSTGLLELDEIPESLIVVGAGAIGLELGHFFGSQGSKVTIVEAAPHVAPLEDTDIADELRKILTKSGKTCLEGVRAQALVTKDGRAELTLADGRVLTAAKALVAVGRTPNSDGLGCEAAGCPLNRRGYVQTDEYLQAAPHVHAIGDINGRVLLAHAAEHQAHYVARRLLGQEDGPYVPGPVPSCYYGLEIMRVGDTAAALLARGKSVSVSQVPLSLNPIAQAGGLTGGFVKAVWDGDRLAGMAAIGHGVSHLVTVAQLLVMQGATPDNLHRIMFAHPTLDEIIPAAIAAKRTPVSA
ncbi:NAD(P)/FAD-dependent oxidoreductase [Desulfovibrio piger]|uniref:dihydrolipoyl dehydrogenase family protein n=1 Tax=Desulfovibrio piger TaxID=901 RepID=UPI0025A3D477|nr:NAD(P)/FAD-dependent oxidoreductase [Desulfovibrio piger]MDM8330503.1 NAD(P)/FAD-dependent oxidoreductase [Desulfovibrio piger]